MQTTQREKRGLPRTLWILAGGAGLVMGLWLTFNTSRGETFTGIICACVLVSLVKGRGFVQYAKWMAGQVAVLVALAAIVFFTILPQKKIEELSWRYSANSMAEASNDRMDLSAKTIEMALASPRNLLIGIGARGCEKRLGIYPHNHFVQAFGETGIIGFGLLCFACLLAFRFGLRTLDEARSLAEQPTVIFAALMLSLFIYQLIVLSKKGSLTFVDTTMWLGIATFSFDRAQFMLERVRGSKADATLDGSEGA
jgi:O-antigen ligase